MVLWSGILLLSCRWWRNCIVEDGDTILIDAEKDELTLKVSSEEIEKRLANWINPKIPPQKGVLSKFAKSVKSASLGAITD